MLQKLFATLEFPRKNQTNFLRYGLTMIELLIVIAIVAVLAVVFLLLVRNQLGRSRDAERKADLEKIKIAFEEYYNDNGCYPPRDILDSCGGDQLQPYLRSIPCDPITGSPYLYIPLEGAECSGYRVFTDLEDDNDPNACVGPNGCNVGDGFEDYNYGVSAGVPVDMDGSYTGVDPGDGGLGPGTYACSPGIPGEEPGVCNVYADPGESGCPTSFASSDCDNTCDNEANWCNE
jgi:prepilin-type N-terminal cleavage/methylation domain-containing protein